MDSNIYIPNFFYILSVLSFTGIVLYSTWFAKTKLAAGFIFCLGILGGYVSWASYNGLVSFPKSFQYALTSKFTVSDLQKMVGKEIQVLSFYLVPDKAIYIWVLFEKETPRYYELPWDKNLANRMLEAKRKGKGGKFKMKIPRIYEKSLENRSLQIYPNLPPVLPDKPYRFKHDPDNDREKPDEREFQHPSREA